MNRHIYFSSTSCSACKLVSSSALARLPNLTRAGEFSTEVGEYNVTEVPTLAVISSNGKLLRRIQGADAINLYSRSQTKTSNTSPATTSTSGLGTLALIFFGILVLVSLANNNKNIRS